MKHSLRLLFFITSFAAIWMAIFQFSPQIAFLMGCLTPSIAIALSYRQNHSKMCKFAIAIAFVISMVLIGIVLHSCCYFLLGSELMNTFRPWIVSLCRMLDRTYLELIDTTCGKDMSSKYLHFLSWSFDRGVDLSRSL